jgi:CheY-like chemotaxis protein
MVPDRRYCVLCVDDEPSILTLRKMLLEAAGYSVLTASSGKEAMNIFNQRTVDAAVVDYSMPEMDGGTVSALMKQQRPRMPVIMLSAYSGARDDVHKVVDAFIEKGGDPDDLLAKLESLIKVRSHSHPELKGNCIIGLDSSQRFVDCSDAVCELLGYGRAEMIDKVIEDISYKGEEPGKLWEEMQKNSKSQGDHIMRHKSGRPVFIRYQAWFFSDGCIGAVWTPVSDWRELYRAAMLELNPVKLKNRVELALLEIHRRMREVEREPSKNSERAALNDALNGLRVLQREH